MNLLYRIRNQSPLLAERSIGSDVWRRMNFLLEPRLRGIREGRISAIINSLGQKVREEVESN